MPMTCARLAVIVHKQYQKCTKLRWQKLFKMADTQQSRNISLMYVSATIMKSDVGTRKCFSTASLAFVERNHVEMNLVTLHPQAHGPTHPLHTRNDRDPGCRPLSCSWEKLLDTLNVFSDSSKLRSSTSSSWSRTSRMARHRNRVLAAAICLEWSNSKLSMMTRKKSVRISSHSFVLVTLIALNMAATAMVLVRWVEK